MGKAKERIATLNTLYRLTGQQKESMLSTCIDLGRPSYIAFREFVSPDSRGRNYFTDIAAFPIEGRNNGFLIPADRTHIEMIIRNRNRVFIRNRTCVVVSNRESRDRPLTNRLSFYIEKG